MQVCLSYLSSSYASASSAVSHTVSLGIQKIQECVSYLFSLIGKLHNAIFSEPPLEKPTIQRQVSLQSFSSESPPATNSHSMDLMKNLLGSFTHVIETGESEEPHTLLSALPADDKIKVGYYLKSKASTANPIRSLDPHYTKAKTCILSVDAFSVLLLIKEQPKLREYLRSKESDHWHSLKERIQERLEDVEKNQLAQLAKELNVEEAILQTRDGSTLFDHIKALP